MGMLRTLKNEIKVLRNLLYHRIYVSPKTEADVVREFHKLYYNAHTFTDKSFGNTTWMGTNALKCPLDLWVYQELIFKLQPDLLIETGTCDGGGALYLSHICDLVGKGRVVTVDIEHRQGRPQHPRLTYLTGSSTAPDMFASIRAMLSPGQTAMVFLDSNHEKDHVLEELRLYRDLVPVGGYLIVEDTNINGHPVYPSFGPGPMEALDEFLKEDPRFVIDESREKFFLTFNPRGFLKRVR